MKKPVILFVLAAILLSVNTVSAQSTFSRVHEILQANCTTSGCHGSDNTQVFDVSGSAQDVYTAIVGVAATNATAASKNNKLVYPGHPHRSFLLRKVINGLEAALALEGTEGNACPQGAAALANAEIELIRQWIMFGAPQSGKVVEEQLLIDFYNGKGLAEIQAPPAPPAEQGFQVHDGPIFLAPGEEKEFQWKYNTELPAQEVVRVEARLSPQSHHYIVYKYNENFGNTIEEGHVEITSIVGQFDVQINGSMIATWQYNRDHELPAGTAYYWEENAVMSSNFHVRNYSDDSILAAHAYLNVYTEAPGSGNVQMFSELAVYGGLFNPFALTVPPGVSTLSFVQVVPETRHFWILQAHTHKYGDDYDIFLRNSDGSRGDQIYEGFYNYDGGFNKGYYDYAHPPVLEFSPMRTIDMNNGLVHEAKFDNTGNATVNFGLTTADEMFITYMHYTKELPTAIRETKENEIPLSIYPNPTTGAFNISYSMPETANLKVELFNMLGECVAVLKNETVLKGTYWENMGASNLAKGIYFVRLSSPNHSGTTKVVVE